MFKEECFSSLGWHPDFVGKGMATAHWMAEK
jgi:hypothetical protein